MSFRNVLRRANYRRQSESTIAQGVNATDAHGNPVTAAIVKPITLADPNIPGQSITLSNFFVANPRSPTNSWLMDNIGQANYHSLQMELRRRMFNQKCDCLVNCPGPNQVIVVEHQDEIVGDVGEFI